MQAVSITINYPLRFIQASEDRDFVRVGQKLGGYVTLDSPGRPKRIEIRWRDGRGHLLGRDGGRFEAYNRRVHFEFEIVKSFFWMHWIECEIDGVVQAERAQFVMSPPTQGWETMPAVTWATYPDGAFHDRLQEVGINGEIAYKLTKFDHVAANAMRFYVDNSTPDEISVYHRPYRLFWEPPAEAKPPYCAWGRGFRDNWKGIQERYVRMRRRARREGITISRDDHFRRLLWRDFCPNAPGVLVEATQRLAGVVRLHKGFRPLFYNMADEAGITDQCKAFDFCFCPWCMDKFRRQLEQRYQTLSHLNAEWGTTFERWDEVFPLTTDETMDAQTRGQPLNFASWNDHRAFMDDTFVNFFRELREAGRHWDPIGDFSHGGCQGPSAFGGWDYAKVVKDIDALIPYNIGGNQEAVRSFRPELRNISPFFGDDESHIRGIWYAYLHGDAGVIFWDADEAGGRFVERPSGTLSRRGKLFGPALREIRGGYAQQFKAWRRTDDPIGLLYSQPSLRAHWLMEAMARRKQEEWFAVDGDDGRYQHVRVAWQKLIEDRQLQYRYVSYLEIDEQRENLDAYRLIVLPETVAVSERLAAALRHFVQAGGVLVADGRCARMDGQCRQVEDGLLDGLFGVRHGPALTLKAAAPLRLAGKSSSWLPEGLDVSCLRGIDAGLRLEPGSGAEAAAMSGKAPALIRRRCGKGWAVYLNADVHAYNWERYDPSRQAPDVWRAIADTLCALADVRPAVHVEESTLGTTAGIEMTRFTQGSATMLAALVNRTYNVSGVGEKLSDDALKSFETRRKLHFAFDGPAHTWNSRSGAYLGEVDTVEACLDPLTPLILSRLPYMVHGLALDLPRSAARGQKVDLKLQLQAQGLLADHVARVDVYDPEGRWCYWYSDTLLLRQGGGAYSFNLALNDPVGRWRVAVRDTVTGTTVDQTLQVKK
jgi:hypothetical protein